MQKVSYDVISSVTQTRKLLFDLMYQHNESIVTDMTPMLPDNILYR